MAEQKPSGTEQKKPAEGPLTSLLRIGVWLGCGLLVGFLVSYCVATIGEGIGAGIGGVAGGGGSVTSSVPRPTVLERYWQPILLGTLLAGGLGSLVGVLITVAKRSNRPGGRGAEG
jgi:hypothetical protein